METAKREEKWSGVFPAATTQFKKDGSLDIPATLTHLDAMVEAGVHGFVMIGTVGENCSLETSEKLELLSATADHFNGKVPILSGVAEYTTAQACHFAAAAKETGIDGLMVLPAMVYKTDERETVAHFRAVAGATDLPIMIYNNPVSRRSKNRRTIRDESPACAIYAEIGISFLPVWTIWCWKALSSESMVGFRVW